METMTLTQQTARHTQKQSKKPDAAAAFQHILTLPSSAAAQAALKEKRSYKCTHCSTTFRRSEHCIRHERSHTLEKPFGCSLCGCNFSRKDLLVRHERTVHSSSRPSTSRPTKRQRTASTAGIDLIIPSSLPPTAPTGPAPIDIRPAPTKSLDIRPLPTKQFDTPDYFLSLSPTNSSPSSIPPASFSYSTAQPMTPPSDISEHPRRRRSSQNTLSTSPSVTPDFQRRDSHASIASGEITGPQQGAMGASVEPKDTVHEESYFHGFFPRLDTPNFSAHGEIPEMSPIDNYSVNMREIMQTPRNDDSMIDLFHKSEDSSTTAPPPISHDYDFHGSPTMSNGSRGWEFDDPSAMYESIHSRLQDTEFELSTGGQARLTPESVGLWAGFMADNLYWAIDNVRTHNI